MDGGDVDGSDVDGGDVDGGRDAHLNSRLSV